MVSVVQLVEHRIVVPSVVGSSPITHPLKKLAFRPAFLYCTFGGFFYDFVVAGLF